MNWIKWTCWLIVLGACASPQKYEAKNVDSPMPDELLSQEAYVGTWEIEKCLNSKQAESVAFEKTQEGLKLKRWQWKQDHLPLFEVEVKPQRQNIVTYQSKDMHDLNPVINHSTWTWNDNRVVGSFQWQPDKEDQRGNWSGVAMAQFYIKRNEPTKLYWNRWGTSHSNEQGLTRWESSCTYSKVNEPKVIELEADIDESFKDEFIIKEVIESNGQVKERVEARSQKGPEETRRNDMMFLRKSRGQSNQSQEEKL